MDIPRDLLAHLFCYLDLASYAKLETTCQLAREVGRTNTNLHCCIVDMPTDAMVQWLRKRANQVASLAFNVAGPSAPIAAAYVGAALVKAENLTSITSAFTDGGASWILPAFLKMASWDESPVPPLRYLSLGRAHAGLTPHFLGSYSATLESLSIILNTEKQIQGFFSLDLPKLKVLSMASDVGLVASPASPLCLPAIRSIFLQSMAFAATPFQVPHGTLENLGMVCCFFKCSFSPPLKPTSNMAVFWAEFPSDACVDVSELKTLNLNLGVDTEGKQRRVPPTQRFPRLQALHASDPSLHGIHPSQIPFVNLSDTIPSPHAWLHQL